MLRRERVAYVMFAMLLVAAVLANAFRPSQHRAELMQPLDLESIVPRSFGRWSEDRSAVASVVNPQQVSQLNRLYTQTLSRTYVNEQDGARIMLSIAYSKDQRDGVQLHYPEVCYPTQGFELLSSRVAQLDTQRGTLPVRRLETVLNRQRYEAITYWTVVGDQPTLGGVEKKLIEMRFALSGQIVDGLVFRVSSIGADSSQQFQTQSEFVSELMDGLESTARRRLTGLSGAA